MLGRLSLLEYWRPASTPESLSFCCMSIAIIESTPAARACIRGKCSRTPTKTLETWLKPALVLQRTRLLEVRDGHDILELLQKLPAGGWIGRLLCGCRRLGCRRLGCRRPGTGCGPASAFSDVGKLGAAAVFSGEDVSELVASFLSTSGSWGSGPTALKRPMTVWNLEATKGLLARARVGRCCCHCDHWQLGAQDDLQGVSALHCLGCKTPILGAWSFVDGRKPSCFGQLPLKVCLAVHHAHLAARSEMCFWSARFQASLSAASNILLPPQATRHHTTPSLLFSDCSPLRNPESSPPLVFNPSQKPPCGCCMSTFFMKQYFYKRESEVSCVLGA